MIPNNKTLALKMRIIAANIQERKMGHHYTQELSEEIIHFAKRL